MDKLTSTTGILISSIVVGIIAIIGFAVLLDDTSRPWQLDYADELGLDLTKFEADLENEEVIARVEADVAEAESRGVNSTPSVFVNGEIVNFQFDINLELRTIIDEKLESSNQEVVLVEEFADFQCPACANAQPAFNGIKEYYGDQINFVYRHFPLESIHPFAKDAAIAAEAAREQDMFDEMHDLLFEHSDELASPSFDASNSEEEAGSDDAMDAEESNEDNEDNNSDPIESEEEASE